MRSRIARVMTLFGIAALGAAAAAVAAQGPAPKPLPGELRAHLREERFQIVTSIRGLPLGVRDALQTLFDSSSLDIAEPGAPYREPGTAADSTLPIRRLTAAGCSADHCLVYYERGGTGRTWHAALFHWTPAATRFEWGGTGTRRMATVEDVRNAVLSGGITAQTAGW